jgi:transcriptional regulator with XRE-family HTH domain
MSDMSGKANANPSSPIQIAREEAGLSREGLAFKAGMSLRTIERIEAGQVQPHRATVRAIAEALDLTPAALGQAPGQAESGKAAA